ncbi:MAG: hypothetical protein SchgKO_24030 [Schleiferiaceae bacterium]
MIQSHALDVQASHMYFTVDSNQMLTIYLQFDYHHGHGYPLTTHDVTGPFGTYTLTLENFETFVPNDSTAPLNLDWWINSVTYKSQPIDLNFTPIPSTGWTFEHAHCCQLVGKNLDSLGFDFTTSLTIFPNAQSSAALACGREQVFRWNAEHIVPLVKDNPSGDSVFVEFMDPNPSIADIGFTTGYSFDQPLPGLNQGAAYDPYIDSQNTIHFDAAEEGNHFVSLKSSGYQNGQLAYVQNSFFNYMINHRDTSILDVPDKRIGVVAKSPNFSLIQNTVRTFDIYCNYTDTLTLDIQYVGSDSGDVWTPVELPTFKIYNDPLNEAVTFSPSTIDSSSGFVVYYHTTVTVIPSLLPQNTADSTSFDLMVGANFPTNRRYQHHSLYFDVQWQTPKSSAKFCEVGTQNGDLLASVQCFSNHEDSLQLVHKFFSFPNQTTTLTFPAKDTLLTIPGINSTWESIIYLQTLSGERLDSAFVGDITVLGTAVNSPPQGVKVTGFFLNTFYIETLKLYRSELFSGQKVLIDSLYEPNLLGNYSFIDTHPNSINSNYYIEVTTGRNCVEPYSQPSFDYDYTHLLTSIYVLINQEEFEAYHAKVYPNPTNDRITIEAEDFSKTEVYSISGQLLMSETHPPGTRQKTLDISHLKPGLYLLNITSNAGDKAIVRIQKF